MHESNVKKPTEHVNGFIALMALVLLAFTLLGGIPSADKIPTFVVGVALTIAITAGVAVVSWHLLLRPLPAGHKQVDQPVLTGVARHAAGVVILLGVLNVGLAGIWDEIWHVRYGIPFGEDFFWRPHMMMYFGFGVTMAVTFYGLFVFAFKRQGTIQQRFRSDMAFGFAILVGVYLMFALPADPIWHRFYGTDLTAWSLPHLIILVLHFLMGVSAVMLMRSRKAGSWKLLGFTFEDLSTILAFTAISLSYFVIFGVDWYTLPFSGDQSVIARPAWMFPAILSFMILLIGVSALRSTRKVGSATLVGLLALAFRAGGDAFLSSPFDGTIVMWAALPLLLALDVVYGIVALRSQRAPSTIVTALGTVLVGGTGMIAVIGRLFVAPQVELASLPSMLLGVLVSALVAIWMGERIGDSAAAVGQPAAEADATPHSANRFVIDALVYLAFAAFMVFFIATATPPVI